MRASHSQPMVVRRTVAVLPMQIMTAGVSCRVHLLTIGHFVMLFTQKHQRGNSETYAMVALTIHHLSKGANGLIYTAM